MKNENTKKTPAELNAFRGWLLVFLLMHVPLALINFSTGFYMLAGYLKSGAGPVMAAFSLLFCLPLPISLFLLIRRKRWFRPIYALYCAVTAANYLLGQGLSGKTLIFVLMFSLPWLLYVFRSRRVQAVLENTKSEPVSAAADTELRDAPVDVGAETQGGK